MMYPSIWDPNEVDEIDMKLTPTARLLQAAADDYFVQLRQIDVLHHNGTIEETWADSYTKLLAFNLTEFDRVLAIDSDSIVLQNLDELFLLPKAPLAMPFVYWGEPTGWEFSSQMMLISPSVEAFSNIETAIQAAKDDEYDMDIINKLYKGKILRIPQRPYDLLTGEFRRKVHAAYLGSKSEKWDPDAILSEAKFMHFSDWPVPKPWMRSPKDLLNKHMPKCRQSEWFGATDCRDRTIWLKLYYDFAMRRKAVCGPGFELQSQELPPDSIYRHGRWFHPDEVG
jgi:alpha-N-acetylglucosamine transferase